MAFTIHQQPEEFTPAYNKNVFVVSSTNSAQPNFKYVAKAYIGTETITIKQFPNPDYGSAYFDFGRDVERLVTYDINIASSGIVTNPNSISSYYVEFYEEYDIAGVLTLSALLATSSTIKVFNGEIGHLEYANYSSTPYVYDLGTEILNHGLTRKYKVTDNGYMYLMLDDVTTMPSIQITTYDSAGTLIDTYTIDNNNQTNGTLSHHHIRVPSAPYSINLINNADITGGAQPLIDASVYSYQIDFGGSSRLFELDQTCTQYDRIELHYLNEVGAFETFYFDRVSDNSEETQRTKYKNIVGGLTSVTAFGYSVSDKSTTTNYTQVKEKYKLRSNWISAEYNTVLKELIESPVVFMYGLTDKWDSEYGLIPVEITTPKWDRKLKSNKRMINLEIELEMQHDKYRQRF